MPRTETAERVKLPDGQPSPPCQRPGCHRRAAMAYRDRATGLRVFRRWCNPCRPTFGQRYADRAAVPRPYHRDPGAEGWPADEKCPFCPNRREIRSPGVFRRTCRKHRGKTVEGPKLKQGRVRIHPKKKKVTVKRKLRLVPKPKPKPVNELEVTYHEGRKRHTLVIDKGDFEVLQRLHHADVGYYRASTHPQLSKKYPTSAITALFGRWDKKRYG